jgi:beta-1,4-mannosyltransferase
VKTIRVIQSFETPGPATNPYIVMLGRSLADTEGIEHSTFSWRRALFGRYDVIHFHLPENLFSGSSKLSLIGKRVTFGLLFLRLRLGRVAVVRTVHNLHLPTDITPYQRWILMSLERLTSLRIRIGEMTVLPSNQPSVLILHGDYREWFANAPLKDAVLGRLGFVGLIRRYKGVEGLITAFRGVDPASAPLSLAVSGQPSSEDLAVEIVRLIDGDPRVSVHFGFLTEDEFARAITEAEIVVLPYRLMHNSGSVLAALSLNRPVLVPRNESNEALAREVGPGWVHMFDDQLDATDLVAIAEAMAGGRSHVDPDLSRRGWGEAGRRHFAAYSMALSLRATRRTRGA